jgi:hypothetical protein
MNHAKTAFSTEIRAGAIFSAATVLVHILLTKIGEEMQNLRLMQGDAQCKAKLSQIWETL